MSHDQRDLIRQTWLDYRDYIRANVDFGRAIVLNNLEFWKGHYGDYYRIICEDVALEIGVL